MSEWVSVCECSLNGNWSVGWLIAACATHTQHTNASTFPDSKCTTSNFDSVILFDHIAYGGQLNINLKTELKKRSGAKRRSASIDCHVFEGTNRSPVRGGSLLLSSSCICVDKALAHFYQSLNQFIGLILIQSSKTTRTCYPFFNTPARCVRRLRF